MIIPYSTEVLIKKLPVSNLLIMAACIVSFAILLAGGFSRPVFEAMVLSGWSPAGLIGYQFMHGGLWHLLFNMLYLWVFGNAVCEKTGSLAYAGAFLLTGVVAAAVHNIMDGGPAVGASGAINGIVGIYLVLYPINRINCVYWFFRPGTFDISGFWIIGFWFVVDAWQALSGAEAGIAYWAHVGGFLSGVGLGIVFLKSGVARMAHYDNPTLLDYMGKREPPANKIQRDDRSYAGSMAELTSHMGLPPRAQTATIAPPVAQDINIDCPHCAQNLDIPAEMMGQAFACPACEGAIELQET